MTPPSHHLEVLYEDNHLLVVNKPNGVLVQGDRTGRDTLLEQGKRYIKEQYNKPGQVYLGLVHRIDRIVSGVVVFARTSKAASRLSEEIRSRQVQKTYQALVAGQPPARGHWEDHIERKGHGSHIVSAPQGQHARLDFERLEARRTSSVLEIDLHTGRHHQIRLQCAHHGYPILGDKRYGSDVDVGKDRIALHACRFVVKHPTRAEQMVFDVSPPKWWDKSGP